MQGTILKKKSGNEDKCFKALMEDELRHFVPQFKNVVHMNGESKCAQTLYNKKQQYLISCT